MPEGLPEEQEKTEVKTCGRIVLWLLVAFITLFALAVIAAFPAGERLMVGWFEYPKELWPNLVLNCRTGLLSAALFMGIVLLAQLLVGMLRARGRARSWKKAHVPVLGMLVVLGVASAISLSGIVREILWVIEAPTLHEKHVADSHLSIVMNEGRKISQGISAFKQAEDRYPETLDELMASRHCLRGERWQEGSTGSVVESYVYLKPVVERTHGEKTPVLLSPVVVRSGRMAVFYHDGNGRAVPADKLEEILKEAGIGRGDE
jgi:hypothetical protein